MKKTSILYFFLLTLAILSCNQKSTIQIACVGDSITEGNGLTNPGIAAYPAALGRLLGPGFKVYNFGRSATTMLQTGDFPYWNTKEFSNVFSTQPNIITIKLGTNDTKPQNWNNELFISSYQAMIDTFLTIKSNPKIYLCLPVPVYEDRWGINDSTVIYGVIPAIKALADKNHLQLIDLNESMKNKKTLFPDGVHPNEEAMLLMAKIMAHTIQKGSH